MLHAGIFRFLKVLYINDNFGDPLTKHLTICNATLVIINNSGRADFSSCISDKCSALIVIRIILITFMYCPRYNELLFESVKVI